MSQEDHADDRTGLLPNELDETASQVQRRCAQSVRRRLGHRVVHERRRLKRVPGAFAAIALIMASENGSRISHSVLTAPAEYPRCCMPASKPAYRAFKRVVRKIKR